MLQAGQTYWMDFQYKCWRNKTKTEQEQYMLANTSSQMSGECLGS